MVFTLNFLGGPVRIFVSTFSCVDGPFSSLVSTLSCVGGPVSSVVTTFELVCWPSQQSGHYTFLCSCSSRQEVTTFGGVFSSPVELLS